MRLCPRITCWFWPYLLLALLVSAPFSARGDDSSPAKSPQEIYQALNALRVDPAQVYAVDELRLRRDAVSLIFSSGTVGFLQAYNGRITGVVFSGRGHVTAIPKDPAEKRSLAVFQGVPVLDRDFSKAYLRFDDGAGDEMLADLRRDGASPVNQPEFSTEWDKTVANLNPDQSARLLLDEMAEKPSPFFYAEVLDNQVGAFDVLVDSRQVDSVLIGQTRWGRAKSSYDAWASFAGSNALPPSSPAFAPVSYLIETTIGANRFLTGVTTVDLRASRNGARAILLELSRQLKIESAEDTEGHSLDFFQREMLGDNVITNPGDATVLVFLPEGARAGVTYSLRIAYRGNPLGDAKTDITVSGSLGSWYPRVEGSSNFVPYDMQFRWLKDLQLVATGEKVDEHDDGAWHVERWRSDAPIASAGFALGAFTLENPGTVEGVKIGITVDRDATSSSLPSPPEAASDPSNAVISGPRNTSSPPVAVVNPPVDAAASSKAFQVQIGNAIREERQWMGGFPFHGLVFSRQTGQPGPSLPGLILLSTLSSPTPTSLPSAANGNVIADTRDSVALFREVARQWTSDTVGWSNYRDAWITEGLANYLALVGADAEKPGSHILLSWLDQYRETLAAIVPGQNYTGDEAGPLVHGARLNALSDPTAYADVMDGKGAWIFHMLRMMLRDPASSKPDERFAKLVRDLLEAHRHNDLTTEDLQKAVEKTMTPAMAVEGGHSMDWFFDEFVRATGIPEYSTEFVTSASNKGFAIRGKLIQRNVPDDFVLRVPIYSSDAVGKQTFLGTVITSGEETPFRFVSALKPTKLLIDPRTTLLSAPPATSSTAAN